MQKTAFLFVSLNQACIFSGHPIFNNTYTVTFASSLTLPAGIFIQHDFELQIRHQKSQLFVQRFD